MADQLPSMKLKDLKATHPRLKPFRLRMLRALYEGGDTLLDDEAVMAYVFPRHAAETEESYKERKRRAFYDNEFGITINKVTAGLMQDPLVFDDGGEGDGKKPEGGKLDPYWKELMVDASPPSETSKKSWTQVILDTVTEGLVCGIAWTLCDLPVQPNREGDSGPITRADQEHAKLDRAYPVPVRAASVLNWEEVDGKLLWLRMYDAKMVAQNFWEARKYTTHTWRVWTPEMIVTYTLLLDRDGKDPSGRKWEDEDEVPPNSALPHSFGEVPWVRFEPKLHIGGAIESRCRSLFNESCGETFQRLRHMFQQLYEFLGAEITGPDHDISEAQENPQRGQAPMSRRSADIVQLRGHEDRAEFVSPDMSGAAVNREALRDGRDSIGRTTGQLAMQADVSGAMIKRSGESKAQDKIAEEIVLGATGKDARAHAVSVARMLARGRGDSEDTVPAMRGFEDFDVDDTSARVEQVVALTTAPIKSATFAVEWQWMLACKLLGDGLTPELKAKIREDLESAITQENMLREFAPPVPAGHQLDEEGNPTPLPPVKPEPEGGPPKKKPAAKK